MAAAAAYTAPSVAMYSQHRQHHLATDIERLANTEVELYNEQESRIDALFSHLEKLVDKESITEQPFVAPSGELLDVLFETRLRVAALLHQHDTGIETVLEQSHDVVTAIPDIRSTAQKNLQTILDTSLSIWQMVHRVFAHAQIVQNDSDHQELLETLDDETEILSWQEIRQQYEADDEWEKVWIETGLAAEAASVAAFRVLEGSLVLDNHQINVLADNFSMLLDQVVSLIKMTELPGSEAFVTRDEFLLELAEANTAPPRRTTYTTLDHLFAD